MSRTISAALLLCGLASSPALAQSPTISNQIDTLLAPNARGAITANGLQTVLRAMNNNTIGRNLPTCTPGSTTAPVPSGQPFLCGGFVLFAQ
jgi:hypothetical protein